MKIYSINQTETIQLYFSKIILICQEEKFKIISKNRSIAGNHESGELSGVNKLNLAYFSNGDRMISAKMASFLKVLIFLAVIYERKEPETA